jgi:hypothetical protein
MGHTLSAGPVGKKMHDLLVPMTRVPTEWVAAHTAKPHSNHFFIIRHENLLCDRIFYATIYLITKFRLQDES